MLRARPPAAVLDALCDASLPRLRLFSAANLGMAAAGLSLLGHTPSRAWLDAMFARARQLTPQANAAQLAAVLVRQCSVALFMCSINSFVLCVQQLVATLP